MFELNIFIAFFAGLVSFLAPCVLPVIPGFLAYLGGTTVSDSSKNRKTVFMNSLFFVIGFSLVFAILGVILNTILEGVAFTAQQWLARIGGIIIIFFGLYLTGLLKISFLDREHTVKVKKRFKSRYLTSLVFGMAFAVGWTPCVGAALGAILGLAASSPGTAFYLLLSYALGLGVPFLILGLFTGQAASFISRYQKAFNVITIIFGILLIVLGVLVFTMQLSRIASFEFLNRIILS